MFRLRCVVGFVFVLVAFFALSIVPCEAAGWRSRGSHASLVAQSGIRPAQVGSYEGVGVSSVSCEDARNRACYWGQRTPVSVQYSQRGGRYYAVVRYR
jgi:hypothetical protein